MKKIVTIEIVLGIAAVAHCLLAEEQKPRGPSPSETLSAPQSEVAKSTQEPQMVSAKTGTEPLAAAVAKTTDANEPSRKTMTLQGGMAAIQQAAEAKKHLFVFFYEKNDEQTQTVRKVFDATVDNLKDTAQGVAVDRSSPAEKEIVEKFKITTAPMPLVLVLAPNGTVTGGFLATNVNEQRLQDAIVSRGEQECLKSLQQGRLVFLCLQNKETRLNAEAMKGVNDFKSDARFAQATEVVTLDPNDGNEVNFLKKLRIDPKMEEATTAFLAPPGSLLGKFTGATDKEKLVTIIMSSMSSCGSGCGPSGCSPKR